MNSTIADIAAQIRLRDDFTIITHVSPDGDAVGSSLALYMALSALGKRAQLVCDGRMPPSYAFLPYSEAMIKPEDAKRTETAISVDCADRQRMGSAAKLFDAAEYTICIDHHVTNEGFGDINHVDATAAACGEIMFELVNGLGVEVDGELAEAMYTAILTDTGRFSYSNTTARSLLYASKMVELIDVQLLNRRIFADESISKTKLLGIAIGKLELLADNRIGIAGICQNDMKLVHASSEDCEGIVDKIRDIDTVEIAIFIRQAKDGSLKVSMRSKNYADVSAIAAKFGGGGHERAAGCTSYWSYAKTREVILNAALGELEE